MIFQVFHDFQSLWEPCILGAQKNRLIETVLLSTHDMFWLREKKLIFDNKLLTGGLLANSADPDEMPSFHAAFHLNLYCLLQYLLTQHPE